ncbi:beta-propeller fold lactonase family protein [Kaarinaea lacus]
MRHLSARYLRVVLLIALGLITVLGSGGGGGGGGEAPPQLTYVGNVDPAVLTPANATRLLGHVISGSALTGEVPTGLVSDGPGAYLPAPTQLMRQLIGITQLSPALISQLLELPVALAINEQELCYPTGSSEPSGSVTYSGTLNDNTGTGTITITYYDCLNGDLYMDGRIVWQINEAMLTPFDWYPTDSVFTFQVITMSSPQFNVLLGGTLREVIAADRTQTFNVVLKDRNTDRMQKTENLVIVTTPEDYPNYASEMMSGRLYDSIDGYVDITTLQSLMYASFDALYPASGELLLTCAGNARLLATVESDTTVLIALDLDNNSEYEIDGTIPFVVIAEAGSDPGDADGDGMPDSWETSYGLSNTTYADASDDNDTDGLENYTEYGLTTSPINSDSDTDGMPDGWEVTYGFNPLDIADAAVDTDSDQAVNLQEFTYGTDPTDAFSTPADLSVAKSVSLATVSARTLYEYTLSVSNLGPGLARGVTLTDTLPPGVEIYTVVPGILPSPWDCTIGTGTLSCAPIVPGSGTMNSGESVAITVPVIAPVVTGDITNSALITSTTLDFDSGNNTVTTDNSVVSAILSQVDLEVDGVGGVSGMERPFRLAISPDGQHVYVPGIVGDAIVVFSRDLISGSLTFVEAQRDGLDTADQPDFPKAVIVSPDGNHVYVVTEWESALLVYSRNTTTGALTFVEKHYDGVAGVEGLAQAIAIAVSADGENVYVAGPGDNAVAVFDRNTTTGQLTFSTSIVDGVAGVDGLAGAFDVALSPDDAYLYVAGSLDNALAVFSRGAGGTLTYVDVVESVFNPQSIGMSSDGQHLYALGGDNVTQSRGISAFTRDTSSGALTAVNTYINGENGIVGLDGMYGLAIAPDGRYIYVAATYDNALGVFARDAATGELRFIEVQKDGISSVDGLGVAWAVAVSPDSAFVYVSVSSDNAVSSFSVDLSAVR